MISTRSLLLPLLSALALSSPFEIQNRAPTWTSLASIPLFSRQEHATLFLPPSTLAILGGIIPDESYPLPIGTIAFMQFYCITKNTWTSKSLEPRALNHLNAAVVNGKIYVPGGLAENDEEQRAWRVVPDSWVYDSPTDSWSALPNMPEGEARGSAAVGVYGSKIYLASGMTDLELYPNGTQRTVSVVSIFNTVLRSWVEVLEAAKFLPKGRDHSARQLLVPRFSVLDLCDVEAGWKTSAARMLTPRGGVAAGVVGDKVYTFGREVNTAAESGVFDQVEVYDTVEEKWQRAGTMKIPRHGTYAVGVGGQVYVPGGALVQGGSLVVDFDVFTP
ncbi:galactose oxidase [Lentithecium fluviatile CBS 122367]|uniref:Galactose oxidase n=1 Tax=Lentithecium fluviatile CBS 122367 TaxID=1168545 RepID=A0A6G1IPM2_9PLEO|nr:galactose oxidase [Lentithecium fluviatile CBS 122367]